MVVRNGEGGTKRGWNLATRNQVDTAGSPSSLGRTDTDAVPGGSRGGLRLSGAVAGFRNDDHHCHGPVSCRANAAGCGTSLRGRIGASRRTPTRPGMSGTPGRHGSGPDVGPASRHSGHPRAGGRPSLRRSDQHGNRSVGCRAVVGSTEGWHARRLAGRPRAERRAATVCSRARAGSAWFRDVNSPGWER